ncbi:flavin monoamine oxidase family protein [Lentzea albida]|uniref:Tryptophan 2-monooxygenase n=1 Tax=Lentzea albida TaxID=65499 RepID=A0A1H9X6B1_9PSEU|nr:NAD(P)/FAD-dependent oxidoreductase [Lentzea albida]SES41672.1 tryptophan 2-monooxygenase [Lentzea albida]
MTPAPTDQLAMLIPDFPFSYDEWLRHPAGLGQVPADLHGTPVAVIGGGISGLVAAYELMRMGLRPVVYEAGQLGGRMRSAGFPGHPGCVADLGAMRFAPTARTLFHYIHELDLPTSPFPNPLAPCTPSTVINLNGVTHQGRSQMLLPSIYQEVADAWDKTLRDKAELFTMEDAIRRRDVDLIKVVWNRLVHRLDDQSFYGLLADSAAFTSFRHREIFGQVGFGAGGWDTDFPNSALEILRVVYAHADDGEQVSIVGGAQRLPLGLWSHSPARMARWRPGTTIASLNHDAPRPGVTRLGRDGADILVEDAGGGLSRFPAVVFTPHVWTLLGSIDCSAELLSAPQWTAVERTHYMSSSKLFVLSDRPFWLDTDEHTGEHAMGMTLTDRSPRGVYLFDHGPDRPGVMCLSYTWNDDSAKFRTMTDQQRLTVLLRRLSAIYPGVDIASHVISEPVTISWENEPLFMGAFKQNLPGQYRYQRRLFTQFVQRDAPAAQRGFFLCGDDVSWLGGFAEGAVTSALNAVWGVMNHLGGGTDPTNPGPGDRFDELAPVELPL